MHSKQVLLNLLSGENQPTSKVDPADNIETLKSKHVETSSYGMILPPSKCTIDLKSDSFNPYQEESESKLVKPQTITLVPSKIEYRAGQGKSICADQNYICYAVRGGKIRVIAQQSGKMALLRNHMSPIIDLSITCDHQGVSRLGSTCESGTFIVWELSFDNEEISVKPLITIESKDDDKKFRKCLWLPQSMQTLALASVNGVYMIDVEKVLEDQNIESIAGLLLREDEVELHSLKGIMKLGFEGDPHDLCFSIDSSVLAIASDYSIAFYDVLTAHLIHTFHLPTKEEKIESIELCGGDYKNKFYVGPSMILIGFEKNRIVKAFSVDSWKTMYETEFVNSDGYSLLAYDEHCKMMVFSNSNRPSIFTFGLKLPKLLISDSSSSTTHVFASLLSNSCDVHFSYDSNCFEYMLEIPICEPILSSFLISEDQHIKLYTIACKAIEMYDFPKTMVRPKGWKQCPSLAESESPKRAREDSIRSNSSKVEKRVIMDEEIEVNGLTLTMKEAELANILRKSDEKLYSPPISPLLPANYENEALANGTLEKSRSLDLGIDGKIITANYAHGFVEGEESIESVLSTPPIEKHEDDGSGSGSLGASRKRVSFSHLSLIDYLKDEATSTEDSKEVLSTVTTRKKSVSPTPTKILTPKEILQRPPQSSNQPEGKPPRKPIGKSASFSDDKYSKHGLLSQDQFQTLLYELKKIEIEKETYLKESLSFVLPSVLGPLIKKHVSEATSDFKASIDEKALEASLSKIMSKSKFTESVSKNIANSTLPLIEKSFKEAFKNSLVPSMEKAARAMFQQISNTLQLGLDQVSKRDPANAIALKNIESSLRVLVDSSTENSKDLLMDSFKLVFKEMQQSMNKQLVTEIKKAVAAEFQPLAVDIDKVRKHSVPTQSPITPIVTQVDIKILLESLVEAGNYEAAFTKALESGDISSVVWLCDKVQTKTIFLSNNTLISQPVILSLIHQLSMDLRKSSSLKLKWIQELLMNLKMEDSLISPHAPKVLRLVGTRVDELIKSFENEQERSVSSNVVRSARVVSMIIRGQVGI